MDIATWITIVKDIVTIIAAPAAFVVYLEFRTSVRQKRVELLDKLYERFYEKEHYKKIRRILDYQPEPEFTNLQKALQDQTADHQLCESFVNYLNFFEHVGSLWRLDQLSLEEVQMLF